MNYASVYTESMRLWKAQRVSEAIKYVESSTGLATGELRGRLLGLYSGFLKRTSNCEQAFVAMSDGLALLATPALRAEVLCSAVDLCITMKKHKEGTAYAAELMALLENSEDQAVTVWRAPALHNYARVCMQVREYCNAVPRLREAADLFEASDRETEAMAVQLTLAEALCAQGQFADADELCSLVKSRSTSDYISARLAQIQSRVAIGRGDLNRAGRLIDRSIGLTSQRIGTQDNRLILENLLSVADLDKAKGDLAGAQRIRRLVQQLAAVGQVDDIGERGGESGENYEEDG